MKKLEDIESGGGLGRNHCGRIPSPAEELNGWRLCLFAVTEIQADLVDAVGINDDEVIAVSIFRVGTASAGAMSQLNTQSKGLEGDLMERYTVPALQRRYEDIS